MTIHLPARPVPGDPGALRAEGQEGSLINFDYNAGLYTVPKQLDNGYLTIGKQRVDFHRIDGRD